MKKIIDCHTHLQTKKLIDEYLKRKPNSYAVVMKAPLLGKGVNIYEEIKDFKNIFLCEDVDPFSEISIEEQLNVIKQHLKTMRVIGIKIYLGYQPIYADDPKFLPVYKFCEANNLSAVFHCGICSSSHDTDESRKYASCVPIGKVAKMFPNMNFIASHFDIPNFDDCLKLITENKNVYTDVSGVYEALDDTPYPDLVEPFISDLKPCLDKFNKEDVVKRVMFGTDYFGIGTGFDAIDEYIKTLEILFGKENEKYYMFENCVNAYPKIREFMKLQESQSDKLKETDKEL